MGKRGVAHACPFAWMGIHKYHHCFPSKCPALSLCPLLSSRWERNSHSTSIKAAICLFQGKHKVTVDFYPAGKQQKKSSPIQVLQTVIFFFCTIHNFVTGIAHQAAVLWLEAPSFSTNQHLTFFSCLLHSTSLYIIPHETFLLNSCEWKIRLKGFTDVTRISISWVSLKAKAIIALLHSIVLLIYSNWTIMYMGSKEICFTVRGLGSFWRIVEQLSHLSSFLLMRPEITVKWSIHNPHINRKCYMLLIIPTNAHFNGYLKI